ncbi:MAG: hypothetical protein PHU14_14470 [Methylovulum sp.]|nr:hypothetical protein [Methylovulum sp.]
MKKILLGAAISAALFGGAAQATITFNGNNLPDAATLADTTVVYLSGSSAQSALIERGLTVGTNEGVCRAGTVHKFMESTGNQLAYICELNTAANGSSAPDTNIPASITTSNLLVYKRNAGGSGKGVVPIVAPAQIEFLNLTSNPTPCTSASSSVFASVKTCAYNVTSNAEFHIPTFGLSDTNPQIFTVASENAPVGTVPGTPPNPTPTTYQIVPGPAVAFGVATTTKLRNALQEAQFPATSVCNPTNAGYTDLSGNQADTADSLACMPNLNRNTIAALFAAYPTPVSPLVANVSAPALGAGKINQWSQFKVGTSDLYNHTSAANKPGSAKVHICSRTIGSGTKAQFGIKFLGNVCTSFGSKVVQHADHSAIAEPGQSNYKAGPIANPEKLLRPMVHAMASGGDLNECLNELDSGAANTSGNFAPGTAYGAAGATAVRWAVGFLSLDQNATLSNSYRFVKIDGVAPTLANVANGTYPDWVEGTFQYNVNQLSNASLKAMVLELISSFGTPSVLSYVNANTSTHTFGTSGFLAVPNTTHPASGTGLVNLAAPVNPLSHAIFPGTSGQATNDCRAPIIYSNNPANNVQGLQLVP